MKNFLLFAILCMSFCCNAKEWKSIKEYQKATNSITLEATDWLKSDRKKNTIVWQNANIYNITYDLSSQYVIIQQCRDQSFGTPVAQRLNDFTNLLSKPRLFGLYRWIEKRATAHPVIQPPLLLHSLHQSTNGAPRKVSGVVGFFQRNSDITCRDFASLPDNLHDLNLRGRKRSDIGLSAKWRHVVAIVGDNM